jgi:hypothetical protein
MPPSRWGDFPTRAPDLLLDASCFPDLVAYVNDVLTLTSGNSNDTFIQTIRLSPPLMSFRGLEHFMVLCCLMRAGLPNGRRNLGK